MVGGQRPASANYERGISPKFPRYVIQEGKHIFKVNNKCNRCMNQETFTFSKWTVKTLEKGRKYVQS